MTTKPAHWAALLLLVVLWGSAYLLVAVALQTWSPAQITGLRVFAGAVVLLVALLLNRRSLPGWQVWKWLLLIALVGNCIPFLLISWGQQRVESGLAGILAGTTPLVVLLLAHFLLHDERLNMRQAQAFVLGFGGIVVLMGPDSLAAFSGDPDRLLHELAVFGGACCYAIATVMARRMPQQHPLAVSSGVMLLATAVMAPFSFDGLALLPAAPPAALFAIAFLGLAATGVASIVYFYLISATGARFTSYLNYLVPVWAVILGSVVLDERLQPNAALALGLIIAGLVVSRRGQ